MTIEERAKELENTIEYCPVGDEYQVLLKALQAERDDALEEAAKLMEEPDYFGQSMSLCAKHIRDLK